MKLRKQLLSESKLRFFLIVAALCMTLPQMVRLHQATRTLAMEEESDCWGCEGSSPVDVEEEDSIRRWGCSRQEHPFIFVHIGKAGGGGVRARLAASALDYNRPDWNRVHLDSAYYYPMHNTTTKVLHKGQFLSSKIPNFIPETAEAYKGDFQFEGILPCAATTPLGQAIACPSIQISQCTERNCDMDYLVYMGHNLLYSEVHWLPNHYLVDWWKQVAPRFVGQEQSTHYNPSLIAELLRNRHQDVNGTWEALPQALTMECQPGPLKEKADYKSNYNTCYRHKEPLVDALSNRVLGQDPLVHAKLLSTLPVTRVTVLREPFSWLASKYMWHDVHPSNTNTTAHNSTANLTWISSDKGALRNKEQFVRRKLANKPPPPPFVACDDIDQAAQGWAAYRARTYMAYLCGEHCLANPDLSLQDLEGQAAYNLRNSFAVVGLLQKTDEFYEMVSQRVAYMDTSLNPQVKGRKHGSGEMDEAKRCRQVYQDTDFQARLMQSSPEVAALNRLYQIGVEVNEFQRLELQQCSNSTLAKAIA